MIAGKEIDEACRDMDVNRPITHPGREPEENEPNGNAKPQGKLTEMNGSKNRPFTCLQLPATSVVSAHDCPPKPTATPKPLRRRSPSGPNRRNFELHSPPELPAKIVPWAPASD